MGREVIDFSREEEDDAVVLLNRLDMPVKLPTKWLRFFLQINSNANDGQRCCFLNKKGNIRDSWLVKAMRSDHWKLIRKWDICHRCKPQWTSQKKECKSQKEKVKGYGTLSSEYDKPFHYKQLWSAIQALHKIGLIHFFMKKEVLTNLYPSLGICR